MSELTVGVVGTSTKENEHRLPIHPDHLRRIPERYRGRLRFESGYGARFGVGDGDLERFCGGLASREEILAGSDLVILPKPMTEDFRALREGAVFWGWPHCVQQQEVTQIAIDRRLTLIAFEAMYGWSGAGVRGLHTFAANNELAGYCSVLHALGLRGIDGHYGRRRRAAVLSFGSVGRGAVHALRGRGFTEVTIYTGRPPVQVAGQMFGCRHLQMREGAEGAMEAVQADGTAEPLVDHLAGADLIVNATLQDPERPRMFLREGEVERLRPGSLIVDVSCDEGMGFPFARPTTFEEPTFRAGGAIYYGVDHSPSHLWDAATWEVSEALLPYLPSVLDGPEGWRREETVARAIEIRDGVVQNPTILSFQNREEEYPHRVRK